MTFGSENTVVSVVEDYTINVIINNGKIIKEASVQPSGVIMDSIYFEIWFEDLEDAPDNFLVPWSVLVRFLCIYCVYIVCILCIHEHTIYTQYIHNIYTITEANREKIQGKPMVY